LPAVLTRGSGARSCYTPPLLTQGNLLLEELESACRREAEPSPPSFLAFARSTVAFSLHAWQERFLCPLIERLAHERGVRALIHAPPQYGKSIWVGQRAPAWLLGVDPLHRIGLACYNETHAEGFGQVVKSLMLAPEYADAFPDPRSRIRKEAAAGEFFTAARQALSDAQPSFKAMGLQSGFTGRGVDTLIIDDPYRSAEDARSELINEKVWRFWKDTAGVRIGEAANVVVMFHRYSEDDLAGRLLASGGWEYYRFPAVADGNEDGSDPTGREFGELLSPMRSAEWLEAQERTNPLTYLGQFQGRPTSAEGLFFQVGKLEIVDAVPAGLPRVRYWDKAGAQPGKGDWTAGVRMSRAEPGFFYVEDVERGQWPAHERNPIIRQTAELDQQAASVKQWVEQPPGLAKESTDAVIRLLAGLPCEADPVTKDKVERAEPFAAQVNAGNVRLVRGAWNTAFIEELRAFPQGKHDDQVDGASGAFNKLSARREADVF
jgi:predicted phage terminase large subunit-like protein